jgi:hypothetical protein
MRSSNYFTSALFAVLMMPGYEGARAAEVYHDETRAYIGLQWIYGDTVGTKPNVVLGLRQSRTRTSNIVTGGDLSLAFSLNTFEPDAIRISYLEGKCNFIGQYGFGYSMKKQASLFFVGVVGPYSKVFAEIDSGKNPAAGLELNTQDCAGKVIG